ncbi:hypothetical protein Taro_042027 [Colocasia esculenta]|uniref:Uncharacterized protein n=1 Tax=Colocasia esculenta TaxID=4460 RepID=A0A843WYR1_COLES|nr:hypothetical protein [Colocasia esculenta]
MKRRSQSRRHTPTASSSSFSSSKAASNSHYQEGNVPPPNAAGTEEVGLFTDEDMAASVAALESLLGYTFRDPRLAEEALTHPSAQHPSAQRRISYQRLEFMGDAALGLAVANHLYLTYPEADPGRLTTLRAANVSTEKLARVALRHGVYRHLRRKAPALDAQVAEFAAAVEREEDEDAELAAIYGGASMKAPKVLADVVESVAAAVFVDTGFDLAVMWRACRGMLEPIITPDTFHEQPVSALNRLCQQRGWSLDFKSWRNEDRTVVNAFVNGDLLGIGSSDQKQLAKLNAARHALQELSLAILEAQEEEMWEKELLGVIDGGGDAVGGKEELTDEKGTEVSAGESSVENNPVVIDGEGLEELVEGAKMKLNIICGKNHWPLPVGMKEEKIKKNKQTLVFPNARILSEARQQRDAVSEIYTNTIARSCVRNTHTIYCSLA